jgi:hypothetical protein
MEKTKSIDELAASKTWNAVANGRDGLEHQPVWARYMSPILHLTTREWNVRDAVKFNEDPPSREREITCGNDDYEFYICAESVAKSHGLGLDEYPDFESPEGFYGTLGHHEDSELLFAVVGLPDEHFKWLFEELWRGGVAWFSIEIAVLPIDDLENEITATKVRPTRTSDLYITKEKRTQKNVRYSTAAARSGARSGDFRD